MTQKGLSRAIGVARGMFWLGHPFATSISAAAGVLFFLIAIKGLHRGFDATMLFVSIYCILYSIGAMNDYSDEPNDRLAGRTEKPLVAGNVSRTASVILWVATAILGFAASFYFGAATLAICVSLWIFGVLYNFWLKHTAMSWLPLAAFFPSLPSWAFIAAAKYTSVLLLCYPVGALLSVGLNIANSLPDLDYDARAGVSGLAHRLGLPRAIGALWLCFSATLVLMASTPLLLNGSFNLLAFGLGAGGLLLIVMMADWLLHRSQASLRRVWYLSAIFAAVSSVSWIASLP